MHIAIRAFVHVEIKRLQTMSGVLKRMEIMLRQSLAWAATSLQQLKCADAADWAA
jgi:hypothetical protein